jgi:DNA-binding response OmpR family regulator
MTEIRNMSLAETALPHRQVESTEDVYDDGYLRIEHKNYYVACEGRSIRLPRTEFLLISRLARSVERTVSAEDLWRFAWGNQKPFNTESLKVYIYRLRSKLLPYQIRIDTLVNVGYRLPRPEPSAGNLP